MPLNEAMAKVVADAGKSFDPKVVEILHRRYVELEKLAKVQPLHAPPKLSTDIKVERGLAPDAGFCGVGENVCVKTRPTNTSPSLWRRFLMRREAETGLS